MHPLAIVPYIEDPKKKHWEILQVEWEIRDVVTEDDKIKDLCVTSPSFDFARWKWQLGVRRKDPVKFFNLRIERLKPHTGPALPEGHPLKFQLGLKKMDGRVETYLDTSPLLGFDLVFIYEDQLLSQRNELLPGNNMTISCTLMTFVSDCVLRKSLPFKFINLNGLQNLSRRLERYSTYGSELWNDNCNVTFQVEGKNFKANKAILMSQSAVFEAMFDHDWSETQTSVINIYDCDPECFQYFLVYLHTGELQGTISFHVALQLYSMSDKYNIRELKYFCAEYLEQNLNEYNICDVLLLADMYEDSDLMHVVQNFFLKNFSEVVMSTPWENLLRNNCLVVNRLLIRLAPEFEKILSPCTSSTEKSESSD